MADTRERLTETELEAIEALARENESETYREPLLALVDEVRRLRGGRARSGAARVRRPRRAAGGGP